MNYQILYGSESCGQYGAFGIKILVGGSNLPNLDLPAITSAAYDAAKRIECEVKTVMVASDPQAQARAKQERTELLALFPTPIFVETIPNGYCSDWCCRHLPWFVVTTPVGRIKIGWRKRVIAIDWTGTVGTKTSAELFAAENVTKGERDIHAWNYDDARRYIAAILASAS